MKKTPTPNTGTKASPRRTPNATPCQGGKAKEEQQSSSSKDGVNASQMERCLSSRYPVAATFWVNASRVLPHSFSFSTPEKEKEKRKRKRKRTKEKRKKKKRKKEKKCWIHLCVPTMHVTSPLGLIVLASYDKYTALVKSGNVASKHVWRAVNGAYRWWKPGYRDLLSYVTFLLVMWWLVLCCFSFGTRELV